mmetsp:Transcript_9311/g.19930  ORF Transcript_9311/g.19930 Transcript_9311/m.19930 type:complete len:440 (+) Transcript_9311:118-1437(+)
MRDQLLRLAIVLFVIQRSIWLQTNLVTGTSKSNESHLISKTEFAPVVFFHNNTSGSSQVHRVDKGLPVLPSGGWLQEYIKWHNQQRSIFLGDDLIYNSTAPNILIHVHCNGISGGLNDRWKHFHKTVYHCHLEKILLLISWPGPWRLENFLSPNLLNWTVPNHLSERFREGGWCDIITENIKRRSLSDKIHLSAIDENRVSLDSSDTSFSVIWHSFFLPSELLRCRLEQSTKSLRLQPGHYHAIHCRVRHPAHFGLVRLVPEDYGGTNYTGKQREVAIKTALRAIQCANLVVSTTKPASGIELREATKRMKESAPYYFFSDSEDLVHSVIGTQAPKDSLEMELQNLSLTSNVVGLRSRDSIRHIDDSGRGPLASYLRSFIDLYLAASARCIVRGVGGFAHLAAMISGTDCESTYFLLPNNVIRKWGMWDAYRTATRCPL